jgi:hypothetical protein
MSPIIDGRRWSRERLRFLRALLVDPGLAPERRAAIETEIAQIQLEAGRGGWLFGRWRRAHRPIDL